MSSARRRYSREFKLETIRRVRETGQSQAQVAKELGLSANTLSRWMRESRSDKDEVFPGTGRQTSHAALISRLRRENDRLRKERDFLKNGKILRHHKRARFRVIAAHEGQYPVVLMCRVMRVT